MSAVEPGPLLSRDNEPLFDEPWQAQVMAMAAELVAKGRFTSRQWSETLGEEIRRVAGAGYPDNAATYYQSALNALERLAEGSGLATSGQLADRKAAWIRAYHNTPHGDAVDLSAADPDHHH